MITCFLKKLKILEGDSHLGMEGAVKRGDFFSNQKIISPDPISFYTLFKKVNLTVKCLISYKL